MDFKSKQFQDWKLTTIPISILFSYNFNYLVDLWDNYESVFSIEIFIQTQRALHKV